MNKYFVLVELNWEGESINHAVFSEKEDITVRFAQVRQGHVEPTSFFFVEEWTGEILSPEVQFIYFPGSGSFDALHRFVIGLDGFIAIPAKSEWNTMLNPRGFPQLENEERELFLTREARHAGIIVEDKYKDLINVLRVQERIKNLTWKDIVRMPYPKYNLSDAAYQTKSLGYEFFSHGDIICYIDSTGCHPTLLKPEEVK